MALYDIWLQITNLGDSAVVLPASFVVFLTLYFAGSKTAAFSWGLTILVSGAAILFAKFLCLACYPILLAPALHSPSGHTGISASFYGSLAVMAMGLRSRLFRYVIQTVCAVLVVSISISRVELGAHSVIEVLLGLSIGLAVAALFMRANARAVIRSWTLVLVFFGVAGVAFAMDGERVHAERTIWKVAGWLNWSHFCPQSSAPLT